MRTNSGWINASLLRDFEAVETSAHRLCTIEEGWVERFGRDILISFKRVLARERLVQELEWWASSANFEFNRIFARFIPQKTKSANRHVSYLATRAKTCRPLHRSDTSGLESISAQVTPWDSLSIKEKTDVTCAIFRQGVS